MGQAVLAAAAAAGGTGRVFPNFPTRISATAAPDGRAVAHHAQLRAPALLALPRSRPGPSAADDLPRYRVNGAQDAVHRNRGVALRRASIGLRKQYQPVNA